MAGLRDKAPPALEAGRDALFLDLDGTLVEIADDPAAVRMDARTQDILRALNQRAGGALALITGRTLEAADTVTGCVIAPVGGLHGMQMRIAHQHAPLLRPLAPVRALVTEFGALAASGALDVHIEDKGLSLALHYRHAPWAEKRVHELAEAAAQRHGLRTLKGKMVIEILPQGAGKGDALRTFMQQAPFAGRRPIMVGDDITDESAFAAANELGGVSVLVGAPRQTHAAYRLENVAAVRAWLARALEAAL